MKLQCMVFASSFADVTGADDKFCSFRMLTQILSRGSKSLRSARLAMHVNIS